jgi:hypothetical protein
MNVYKIDEKKKEKRKIPKELREIMIDIIIHEKLRIQ